MTRTRRVPRGAHSPLFILHRAVRLAATADRPGAPPVDELSDLARERLTLLGAPRRTEARVVIVGAGIAGLTAAYHLRRAGVRAQAYEAAGRTGGRMFSRREALAPGLVTEFGGNSSTATTPTCSASCASPGWPSWTWRIRARRCCATRTSSTAGPAARRR